MSKSAGRFLQGKSSPIALACAAGLLCTSTAFAQSTARLTGFPGATPTPIPFHFSGGCEFDDDARTRAVLSVADLVRDYNDGTRWPQLQRELALVLRSCTDDTRPDSPRHLTDALAKTVLVVLVLKNVPYYIVLPARQPYSLTIAGETAVVPVVLVDASARRAAPVDFQFMSSRLDDPRDAQIPAFVKAVAAAVVKGYGVPAAAAKHNPRIWAFAADEVDLPFRRASISESGTLTLNCAPDGSSPMLAACPRGKDAIDVDVATTYTNLPRTRIEFAAVGGAVVGPYRGHLKMKVDAARYASDPANHAMTMAAVAVHLKAYDGALADPSPSERWSLLVGGVLTPAAGVGAGVSFAILRGLAIDAGEMLIWVPSGSSSGAVAPSGPNQLPHRYSYGTFIGASYAFAR